MNKIELEQAIFLNKEALVVARRSRNRAGEVYALINLGAYSIALGRIEEGVRWYEEARTVLRKLGGERALEGRILGSLAAAYYGLGNIEKALDSQQRALLLVRQDKDAIGEATALSNLGSLQLNAGQPEEAIRSCKQALYIARQIGNTQVEVFARCALGLALAKLGQADEAISNYKDAFVIAHELGDRSAEMTLLCNLGQVEANAENFQEAIGYYEHALKIAVELGNDEWASGARKTLDEINHRMKDS